MKFTVFLSAILLAAVCIAAEIQVTAAGQLKELLRNAPENTVFHFPRGEFEFTEPLELERGVTFRLERGARLFTQADDLIRIIGGGEIIIEGIGGNGELVNLKLPDPKTKKDDFYPGFTANVISLENVRKDAKPSLILRNMTLRGFIGIGGARKADKGAMDRVEVISCKFECSDGHMTHRYSEVNSLKVENCTFDGEARHGIYFTSPMPGGAEIRGNTLRNIGETAIRLSGGKFTQVADGCMDYLSNAIVENNRILGGGQRAPLSRSYIHGILIYGNNVIVRGNIVKDFNRGEKIPGAPYGHQFKMPDGSLYEGIWVATEKDPRRRMAGSAIYLKANRAIIANNVCTNSGWRSVIEVKTGKIGPYVLVTGNVVDGSSLSGKESYGFECSSNDSIWSNNLVYNMPSCAFAVRGARSNSFIGNVINDAAIGFRMDSADHNMANNQFINVKIPYSDSKGSEIAMPGSMGKPRISYRPIGENLLKNPNFKLAAGTAASKSWSITLPDSPVETFLASPGENSLIVGEGDKSSNFMLAQKIKLQPERRYRCTLEAESDLPLSLLAKDDKVRPSNTLSKGQNKTELDFTVTAPDGVVMIQIYGQHFGKGKKATLKQITLHELETITPSGK